MWINLEKRSSDDRTRKGIVVAKRTLWIEEGECRGDPLITPALLSRKMVNRIYK